MKVAGCEVRYNSQLFLDAITRIQAAQGIETLVPEGKKLFLFGWLHFWLLNLIYWVGNISLQVTVFQLKMLQKI